MKNIIFTGLFALLVIPLLPGVISCQEVREITKTVDLAPDGRVFIDTYKGSITVDTWDSPKVEIYAKIEAEGTGHRERQMVQDTRIQIDDSPASVRIKTDYDHVKSHSSWFFGLFHWDNNGNRPFVHYKIKMPATASLHIKDYRSDTKITSLRSSLVMETYKGSLVADGLEGGVDMETYRGEARIDMARVSGSCRLETYKGRIELSVPKEAGFELETDLGRKANLDCDFETTLRSSRHDEESHRTTVNNGGPSVRISSEKGDIRIRKKI